jgi:cell division protease FtsH
VTHFLPQDDRHTYSREYCKAILARMLGGRAAEEVVFGEITTGAGNDIEQATNLARKMVCEWGMSEELGPLTYGKREEMIFLGKEIAHERDYSEATAQRIDREVRRLVEEGRDQALKLLRDNVDKLHALAKGLLEREILDAEQIDRIVRGDELEPLPPPSRPVGRLPDAKPVREEPKPGLGPSPDPQPGPA